MRFKRRGPAPLLNIFKDFIDEEILRRIHAGFMPSYACAPGGIVVGVEGKPNLTRTY